MSTKSKQKKQSGIFKKTVISAFLLGIVGIGVLESSQLFRMKHEVVTAKDEIASISVDFANFFPTASLAQTSTVTVGEILTPDMLKILFPTSGSTYKDVPAIAGTVDGNSTDVSKILIRIYDIDSALYFDGARFSKKDVFELGAYGTHDFILHLPKGALADHRFIIAARALMINGASIDFANKISFGVDSKTGVAPVIPTISSAPDWKKDLANIVKNFQPMNTLLSASTSGSSLQYLPSNPNATNPIVYKSSATTTTSTGTVLDASGCDPTSPPAQIKSQVTDLLSEICSSDEIKKRVLNLTPEESYNIKYKEYSQKGLLTNLPLGSLNSVGIRDSDRDGISDKLELNLGTDPFRADSDKDGISDGNEVISYGTNPNDVKSVPGETLVITNIKDQMRTKDLRPVVIGGGTALGSVKLYEMNGDTQGSLIGEAFADSQGKFIIEPSSDLSNGDHHIRAYENRTDKTSVLESQTVSFIVDPNIDFPAPVVTGVTSTGLRPQVFGTTVFGSTVVAHFQSIVENSAVLTDTQSGDFLVSSSEPLESGNHIATLYATLPNGVRSEKVSVPFTLGSDGNVNTFVVPMWAYYVFGPLGTILFFYLLFLLLRQNDMVLFNVEQSEMLVVDNSEKSGRYTFVPKFPITKKDLLVKYIAFQLNGWGDTDLPLKRLTKAKEGYLYPIGQIVETWIMPADGSAALNYTQGETDFDLKGAKVKYVFNILTEEDRQYAEFAGKKLVMYKKIVKGMRMSQEGVTHTKQNIEVGGIKVTGVQASEKLKNSLK